MDLYLAAATPFVAAALIPLLARRAGRAIVLVPIGTAAFLLVLLLGRLPLVLDGGAVEAAVPWAPALGVRLALRLDGLALVASLLLAGIGVLVLWYSDAYLGPGEDRPRFYLYLTLFMAAMQGVFLADDLVTLFVFWELTAYASFLLIGFHDREEAARSAAERSLFVTAAGGLGLLAAAALLAATASDLRLSRLPEVAAALEGRTALPLLFGLLLLAAATKSAQVPFHGWLPAAMVAPTPVSAYLHSATMVKAGVYLLARLVPAFGGEPWWGPTVVSLGLSSMIVGGYLALRDADVKRVLAYSTVSHLGMLVALIGVGTPLALTAMALHLVSHALFKGGLFMAAGVVDHATGSRDLTKLGGLAGALPGAAVAAGLLALALAGVPPSIGYFSKEAFLEALHEAPGAGWVFAVAAAGSLLSFLYAVRLWFEIFAGPPGEASRHPHPPGWSLVLPGALLAAAVLAFGVLPGPAVDALARPAAASVLPGGGRAPELHLVPRWGPVLWTTLAVYAVGTGLFAAARGRFGRLPVLPARAGESGLYAAGLEGLLRVARGLTGRLMAGALPGHLLYVTGFVAALMVGAAAWAGMPGALRVAPTTLYEALVAGLGAAGAVLAIVLRGRIPVVLALSAVGTSVVLLFVLMRAPDLALTQLVVESVAVVLFLLVFRYLPELRGETAAVGARLVRGAVSAAVAAGVLGIGLVAYGNPRFPSIGSYFIEHSLELTGGSNVVNMILVDFRSLDTLGEITVFGVAAVGVAALVRWAADGTRAGERGGAG